MNRNEGSKKNCFYAGVVGTAVAKLRWKGNIKKVLGEWVVGLEIWLNCLRVEFNSGLL
jgi:hypothetical protein